MPCLFLFPPQEILLVIQFYGKRIYVLPKQIRLLVAYLFGYILVIMSFIAFVVFNGSIVVGDKSAHEAAIHLPQVHGCPPRKRPNTIVSDRFDLIADLLFWPLRIGLQSIAGAQSHSTHFGYRAAQLAMDNCGIDSMRCDCLPKYNCSSIFVGRQSSLYVLHLEQILWALRDRPVRTDSGLCGRIHAAAWSCVRK